MATVSRPSVGSLYETIPLLRGGRDRHTTRREIISAIVPNHPPRVTQKVISPPLVGIIQQ